MKIVGRSKLLKIGKLFIVEIWIIEEQIFLFVELEGDRKYHSILAIPCCLDDKVEFVLVVTCTKQGCLEETYKKYQDIIHRYLELIGIMMFIKFGKETE